MKKAVALFLALVMCLSLAACELDGVSESGNYSKGLQYYPNPDGESYCVTGIGTCTDLEINIPPKYEGKPVTEIADQAFDKCKMTAVSIPDTVTTIGQRAFSYCENLVSIRIPAGVSEIPYGAFARCKSLKEVILPDSVTVIGANAFQSCSGLSSITIPNSVVSIGEKAFYECTSLTDISLPTGITKIEYKTFNFCSSLTNIVIPEGVTEICSCAFDSTGLTEITFPESVICVESSAFARCNNLRSVTIPDTITDFGLWVFNYCENLSEITFESGVTSIGEIGSCPALVSISIPSSVLYVNIYGLSENQQLREIHYEGTTEQFLQIEGVTNMHDGITVYCTDGTILSDDVTPW